MLIDTHSHIQMKDFPIEIGEVFLNAKENEVGKIIVVGADKESSLEAIEFANKHKNVFAVVGVHPHSADDGAGFLHEIDFQKEKKIIAIGEIGLDYFYENSEKQAQEKILREQLEFAQKINLPVVFHVRDAYDDFWKIVDDYKISKAVVHSFSDNLDNLNKILAKGWYVGANGIATFTNKKYQIEAYKEIPIEKLLLETDAPYLAPKPHRGKKNQPAYVKEIAEFLSELYDIEYDEIEKMTSKNAEELFNI